MIPLRKSTASQEVLLGPFLNDTDGKTAETGLTINASDIKIWKRGGTTESNKNSGGATHIAAGRYYAVLDATDTDTTGELILNVSVAGALPVRLVCHVYEAAVFDALFASGAAGYQVPIWTGVSSTVNLSNTTFKAVTDAVALPSSAVTEIASGVRSELATELARIDATTSSRSSHSAADVWSVATRTLTAFSFTVAANVTEWNGGALPTIGTSTLTAADVWTYAVSRTLTTTIPTAAAIADAVWDEAYAGHTSSGTFGKLMDTLRKANYVTEGTVASGQTPTTTVFRSGLTAPSGTYDHQTILFTTGVLAGESRPVNTYSQTNGTFTLAEPLTSAPAVGDEFVLLPQHVHPITSIAAGVRTELTAELALVDVAISTRLATAGYTAPDNAGIAAVKAKTDNLPASPAAVSDIPTATTVADAVLGRSVATVQATAGEHSLTTIILAALESNTVDSPGNLRIYRTDGTTVYQTRPLTSDANAEPITGIS